MKVDNDIPLPKRRNTGISQTLRDLKKGDSVLIDSESIHSWLSVAYSLNIGIISRKDEKKGKHRIWKK